MVLESVLPTHITKIMTASKYVEDLQELQKFIFRKSSSKLLSSVKLLTLLQSLHKYAYCLLCNSNLEKEFTWITKFPPIWIHYVLQSQLQERLSQFFNEIGYLQKVTGLKKRAKAKP
ncbi:hypothetical protein DY000_02007193 [Brassica cretica]|uniref:Uncharacterized protein n=1 Tax=Brassica cretica TaxID=69181 RepID=A0ABQ7CB81_BRACR|nr:hypothetical protein DY000_02007193 [Brassica cretica]